VETRFAGSGDEAKYRRGCTNRCPLSGVPDLPTALTNACFGGRPELIAAATEMPHGKRMDAVLAHVAKGHSPAISLTMFTMLRRNLPLDNRVNARVSAMPSDVARNSDT
jgi:hypothetical protein